jgi:lysophospholipase L1-like esterase
MNRRLQFAALLSGLFHSLVLVATAAASEPPKVPLAKLNLQDGDSIVFLGDSITHQCLYTQYVEDYFYTRFPKLRLKFHNAGVGGARAWDALERFDRDVAAYKPKYVTVLLGMNDGSYQPYNDAVFQTYRADMQKLIVRLKEIGATPILMTPTMYDARAARAGTRPAPAERLEFYNSTLAYYGAWLREVAVESGFGFVDMYGPLNNITLEQRKSEPAFTLIRDAVHPDAPGQVVMAAAILNDLSVARTVSSIRITQGNGKVKGEASGGKIADLQATANEISFTWHADSLPLVVPEEAQLGANLTKLGHRLSREVLEAHGLAPGRYELTIDGHAVGVFASAALERHIELQENAKTPQYEQALQVAERNKQRNDGPVKLLRNEWRTFQQHSRMAAQLKMTPDNAALRKEVEASAERLKGLDDRIAQHEAEAKKLEDAIFEINQPRPRKYQLKRAADGAARAGGRVTFNGKPLAGAAIALYNADRLVAQAKTDNEGTFALEPAPGIYRVAITHTAVAAKYGSKESPLTVEVRAGENQLDFDLD